MEHPEHYTADWFSHNIDNWTRWLAEFRGKPRVRCLEVGSCEGRSATWLLKNILTDESSSIDCYDLCLYPDWVARFHANTRPWQHRVRMHPGPSFSTLRQIEGEYDIIYIDGDHSPFGVLSDAIMTWPSLKVGGVLIFDDYLWLPEQLSPGGGVWPAWTPELALQAIARYPMLATKTGIDGFLAAMTGHYEVVEQAYQLAVRKTKATTLPSPKVADGPASRRPAWLRWIRGGGES